MKEEIDETKFDIDAKQIVDCLFDKRLFAENITRDDMIALEKLLSIMMLFKYKSYVSAEKLLKSLDKLKAPTTKQ